MENLACLLETVCTLNDNGSYYFLLVQAFENLVALELVRVAEGSGTRIQKEYRAMTLLITSAQLTDGLKTYPNCPSELKQWATSPITR